VRLFEQDTLLVPNTWIVVRIDGRGFHKLSNHYDFAKPNDKRALELMNAAAAHVVRSIPDICFSYGISDEYSFVFDRHTSMFDRRRDKLVSTVVSTFTAAYTLLWPQFFLASTTDIASPDCGLDLAHLPTFDGRAVVYPSDANLRDYLSWRQVDCHINNLYNTTFWALVQQGGMSQTAAEEHLKGTVSGDKNEILFSRFGINYNDEPLMYRKGSCIFREYDTLPPPANTLQTDPSGNATGAGSLAEAAVSDGSDYRLSDVPEKLSRTQLDKQRKAKAKAQVVIKHLDFIKDDFWKQRPWILGGHPLRTR
jgi:tRNA(His) guanylyltransferase